MDSKSLQQTIARRTLLMAVFVAAAWCVAMFWLAPSVYASPVKPIVERADTTGTLSNAASYGGAMSLDGRYIAFTSDATNLVTGDTNGRRDGFVFDRKTGQTDRVSVDSSGTQGNFNSTEISISEDGRFIAFTSSATNLVANDTNAADDIFVHNMQTGQTIRVSVDSSGTQGNGFSGNPTISPDGRYVAFHSMSSNLVAGDTNGIGDVFVHDMQTGQTTRVSVDSAGQQANGDMWGIASIGVSRGGRYITFMSDASNLIPFDLNGSPDVFVHDMHTGETVLVSVSNAGVQGNSSSVCPAISADGRYIVFASDASNLVVGDGNVARDIFVHDRDTDNDGVFDEWGSNSTTRVSVNSSGTEAAGSSTFSAISSNGRYVAFETLANNLVPGDTNASTDIFLRDLQTNETTRVSCSTAGVQSNGDSHVYSISAMSADGRYIAFQSSASNLVLGDTNGVSDIFVRDRDTDGDSVFDGADKVSTDRITSGVGIVQATGGDSWNPVISADGRFIAFYSAATNLVANDTNAATDVFVYDRLQHAIERVDVSSAGSQTVGGGSYWPSISPDGRYIAFQSAATNLVAGDTNTAQDIFVRDRLTAQTSRVSVSSTGTAGNAGSTFCSISADGRYIVFESAATNLVTGDTNGFEDVFVHDMQTGQTSRISVDSVGIQAVGGNSTNPVISANGRYVAFFSDATNLVGGDSNGVRDVFVHDMQTGQTTRASVDSVGTEGNDNSTYPSISTDGRYVVFQSSATNLAPGANNGTIHILVHDMQTGQTSLASADSLGAQGDSWSAYPAISADGRFVSFESVATNLVAGDTNGSEDCFVHDMQTGQTRRISVDAAGVEGDVTSAGAVISADGRYAVFYSAATNLVSSDTNGLYDVFFCNFDGSQVPTWTGASLTGSSVQQTSLTLTWTEATDTVGVTGYRIYKDGWFLTSVSSTTTSYGVTGLDTSTAYTFKVEAADGAGNVTTNGPQAAIATAAPVGGGGGGGGSSPGTGAETATPEDTDTPNLQDVEFIDVPPSYWAHRYIIPLAQRSIVKGYQDRTFRPSNGVTRAEFAKMMCLAMGWALNDSTSATFADVGRDSWAYRYVETARAHGAISGYPDGTFHPNKKITRAEIAKIIALTRDLSIGSSPLQDIANHWAREYINACVKAGVIGGYADNTFKPNITATRSEAAKMIFSMLGIT